jgi:hypothetical protein
MPVLRRLRQENQQFKATLGYTVGPCLKNFIYICIYVYIYIYIYIYI